MMTKLVRMSPNGQVVIPCKIRSLLHKKGVIEGFLLEYDEKENIIRLTPILTPISKNEKKKEKNL